MDVKDPNWYSRVMEPRQEENPQHMKWDDEADVVIVGLGGAGICAALEALHHGANVVAIDRFRGGGATRMSGGVYYGGGGTRHQIDAGEEDSPEEMYNYLKMEVESAVSDETLKDFCHSSNDNLEWLEKHGVPFGSEIAPIKTSYPADKYFLYYSGNEAQAAYVPHAKSARRGHRTQGKGLTGHIFFDALFNSALKMGLRLYPWSEARRFIVSEDGEISGIEVRKIDDNSRAASELDKLCNKFAQPTTLMFPKVGRKIVQQADEISDSEGRPLSIKVRKSVILTAGGFVQNRKMVSHYAPKYESATPLGGIGCDGSGIRLGQSVGAKVARMNYVSAWRQFNPPAALASGIVVNGKGERYVAEDVYGAVIGYQMGEDHDGVSYVIIDSKLRKQAFWQSMPSSKINFRVQGAPALLGMYRSTTKAKTIKELAIKLGMKPDKLENSVNHYNRSSAGLEEPKYPKHPDFVSTIDQAPYYAIDISLGNQRYICPSISLGGIVVEEKTGQALDKNGRPIPKLYAAGKNAVGVSSNLYVSGLSIADCVYSGRVAGRAASQKSDIRLQTKAAV